MGLLKTLFEPRDLSPRTPPRRSEDLSKWLQNTHLQSPSHSPQEKVTPPRPVWEARPTIQLPCPSKASPSSQSCSTPPSPASSRNQCHGITSTGRRCTRIVGGKNASSTPKKSSVKDSAMTETHIVSLNRMLSRRGKRSAKPKPKVIDLDSDDTSEDEQEEQLLELPKFCHQHAQQAMEETGTFAGSKGIWIVYDEWIPKDLPLETRLQLRHEMAKPTSASEKKGYIYVHEMARTNTADIGQTTLIKIGRSVKPVARLSQWRKQCPNRAPIVRDFFPLHSTHPLLYRPASAKYGYAQAGSPSRLSPDSGSRLRGALLVGERGCPFHHRLERLILIEVAGRAALEAARQSSAKDRSACQDCGQLHLEMFEVNRGAYELWIVDIILRWQFWCERVLAA